ncbi:unnamed protein product [Leuciscus chuanchicus]
MSGIRLLRSTVAIHYVYCGVYLPHAPPFHPHAPPFHPQPFQPPRPAISPPRSAISPPLYVISPPRPAISPPLYVISPPRPAISPPRSAISPPLYVISPPHPAISPPSSDMSLLSPGIPEDPGWMWCLWIRVEWVKGLLMKVDQQGSSVVSSWPKHHIFEGPSESRALALDSVGKSVAFHRLPLP